MIDLFQTSRKKLYSVCNDKIQLITDQILIGWSDMNLTELHHIKILALLFY